MYLHLPVAGQEREAEGDRSSGNEDAVEDRQHCQDLSKCQLWNKDMILLIVMLSLMMMIVTFKMLKFSRLPHSSAVEGGGESQHISKVLQPYQLKGHPTHFLVSHIFYICGGRSKISYYLNG